MRVFLQVDEEIGHLLSVPVVIVIDPETHKHFAVFICRRRQRYVIELMAFRRIHPNARCMQLCNVVVLCNFTFGWTGTVLSVRRVGNSIKALSVLERNHFNPIE